MHNQESGSDFWLANGWRYPRVGGTRGRHFVGTNFKPRKRLENAATPTRRVHAVLATVLVLSGCCWYGVFYQKDKIINHTYNL